MRTIAICSGKGGVGKTTIASNLSVALASYGRVLVIDGDFMLPNLHSFFGLDLTDVNVTSLAERIIALYDDLHVLPALHTSNPSIDEVREIFEERKEDYDYILIDVAAGLNKFSISAMSLADEAIYVVNPDRVSVEYAAKVKKVAKSLGMKNSGVIVNMYSGEKNEAKLARKRLGKIFGVIPESQLIKECREEGVPVLLKDPSSRIAREFEALARRIVYDEGFEPYGKVKALFYRLTG